MFKHCAQREARFPWGLAEPPFPFLTGKNGNIAPRMPQGPICYLKLRDGGTGGQSLNSAFCEKAEPRFLKHVKPLLYKGFFCLPVLMKYF